MSPEKGGPSLSIEEGIKISLGTPKCLPGREQWRPN